MKKKKEEEEKQWGHAPSVGRTLTVHSETQMTAQSTRNPASRTKHLEKLLLNNLVIKFRITRYLTGDGFKVLPLFFNVPFFG